MTLASHRDDALGRVDGARLPAALDRCLVPHRQRALGNMCAVPAGAVEAHRLGQVDLSAIRVNRELFVYRQARLTCDGHREHDAGGLAERRVDLTPHRAPHALVDAHVASLTRRRHSRETR